MSIISWLLEGDIAIQYQTRRDLLDDDRPELKERIAKEGFGKRLLDLQQPDGHWGGGYYRKKWISTHYTLMELRRLNVVPTPGIRRACQIILDSHDGSAGDTPSDTPVWSISDVCMNGMLLHAFAYFGMDENRLVPIIDFILSQQLLDGGYNCDYNRPEKKVRHSSLHSTVSLIEGMTSYLDAGYSYRKADVEKQRADAIEFILMHRLYKSDHTGEVIRTSFTKLSFPPRWKYDILRALDAFREAHLPDDERMSDAIDLLMKKRRKDGTWPLQQKHPGAVHFDMEKTGESSRMNTLRALRVLKAYRPDIYQKLDL